MLEQNERLPMNGDVYIGAVHIVDEIPEYWIGMFFHVETAIPSGFDYVDMEALEYAVCYLYDKEDSSDFYAMETYNMCLEKLKTLGYKRKEDDWRF